MQLNICSNRIMMWFIVFLFFKKASILKWDLDFLFSLYTLNNLRNFGMIWMIQLPEFLYLIKIHRYYCYSCYFDIMNNTTDNKAELFITFWKLMLIELCFSSYFHSKRPWNIISSFFSQRNQIWWIYGTFKPKLS